MALTELQDITTDEILAEDEAKQTQGGSFKDYMDAINPIALKGTRPELRTTEQDYLGDPLDTQDEAFQQLIGMSDVDTQTAMYGAVSNEHAYKIWTARDIQKEAMGRISEDPLVVQLGMGLIPALASPTSLIPVGGAAAAVFRVGQGASRMTTGVRAGLAAAGAGAVANVGDEYILGQQDLKTDYMSALVYGAAFSGPLGFLGGVLSGPMGKGNAETIHGSSDTYNTDFMNDPDFIMKFTEDKTQAPQMILADQGVPSSKEKLQARGSTSTERQSKVLTDRLPWVSDFLNSDVAKAYMHESAVGRGIMTKLVTPSTALYDKVGNAISVGRTAMDFKLTQRGINNRKDLAIDQAFNQAKQKLYMGTRDDFINEVSTLYRETAMKQQNDLADFVSMKLNQFDNTYGNSRDAYLRDKGHKDVMTGKKPKDFDPLTLDTKAEAHRMSQRNKISKGAADEFYANNKVEFKHKSTEISLGAKTYQNFYGEHLNSNKELGMKGTQHTNANVLYAPRLMDWDKFKNTNEFNAKFEKDVYRAFEKHRANQDLTPEDLKQLTKEYVEIITNVEARMNFTHGSFLAPTLSGDARMKGRRFEMDDEVMSPYRINNMEDLSSRYHYQMTGRQAVTYAFGTDNMGDIMGKVTSDMMEKEGKVSNDMLKYIENTVLDLSGQLRMNALSDTTAWQLTRGLQVFNSGRLGGGFGGNQFIELAASMFMNHLPSLLSGRTGKAFENARKALYTGTKDVDEFNMFLVNSGFMEDALHTSKVNRFADTEAGFNSGAIEKGMHGVTDWMYKWNGMRYFKSVMEDMTGGAMLNELPMLASKLALSKGEQARLSRWGLDKDALDDLAGDINAYYKPNEGKLDLESFSELNRDRLQLAIQRGISETVIQGDSLHLPTWMKVPTPAKALLTQFMRFPMIAHNVYLRRGMTDDQARMAAAVVASTVTFMGMKYMREQASVAMGLVDDRDTKYDYFHKRDGMDAMKRGAIESTNYIAPLGMWTTVANYGSNMVAGTELGSDYRGTSTIENFLGPTFGGLAPDLLKLTQEIANNNMTDERTALKAKSLIMGGNLPIVNEALKYMIEEGF